MKTIRMALLAAASPIAAFALSSTPALADHHAEASMEMKEQTEGEKLKALFAESDARGLEINPLGRLFRGDDKNAGRLGDVLTDASF